MNLSLGTSNSGRWPGRKMGGRLGARRPREESVAPAGEASPAPLSFSPKTVWRRLRSQPSGFQIACLYIVFEYVRPQSRFPAIDFLPWTMLVIIAGVVAMLPDVARRGWTRSSVYIWLGLYLLAAIFSLIFAEFPAYGISKWDNLVPWIVIIVLITNTASTRERFLLLILVYILCNLRFSQFGLRSFVLSGFSLPGHGFWGPKGWFQNPGELGVQMAMFTPLAFLVVYALWPRLGRWGRMLFALLPISALITTVGTNSRGAIIAVAVAMSWALLAVGVRLRNIVAVGVLASLGFFLIGQETRERFETMGDDTTSQRRITYINDGLEMIGDKPVTGIGYFNWMPYYTAHFPPVDDRVYMGTHELPHNILIQVTAELGLPGLSVFAVLVGLALTASRRTRRRLTDKDTLLRNISHGLDGGLVAFLIAGQFVTVLYYPYFWISLALIVALHEAVRREELASNGPKRGGRYQREPMRAAANE